MYKHPNGKLKKGDESSGDGTFNKRDLTPVGKRHTPVDKGEPVKVDPKAAAAHERNKNPRVKVPQCAIQSLTEQSPGVSKMEAPSTKRLMLTPYGVSGQPS
jgi:hypothetical protein